MASYGGELVLDSSSPWSGVSNHLSSFSIPLPLIFKKQRTPLMKKIQGLQSPMELHHIHLLPSIALGWPSILKSNCCIFFILTVGSLISFTYSNPWFMKGIIVIESTLSPVSPKFLLSFLNPSVNFPFWCSITCFGSPSLFKLSTLSVSPSYWQSPHLLSTHCPFV